MDLGAGRNPQFRPKPVGSWPYSERTAKLRFISDVKQTSRLGVMKQNNFAFAVASHLLETDMNGFQKVLVVDNGERGLESALSAELAGMGLASVTTSFEAADDVLAPNSQPRGCRAPDAAQCELRRSGSASWRLRIGSVEPSSPPVFPLSSRERTARAPRRPCCKARSAHGSSPKPIFNRFAWRVDPSVAQLSPRRRHLKQPPARLCAPDRARSSSSP